MSSHHVCFAQFIHQLATFVGGITVGALPCSALTCIAQATARLLLTLPCRHVALLPTSKQAQLLLRMVLSAASQPSIRAGDSPW